MPALYPDHELHILKILCATIPTVVFFATSLRLYIKGPRKWWYDDLWVALGVMVMIVQQAVLWSRSIYESPTLAVSYVVVMSTLTQVWLARSSILASVLRLAPTDRTVLFVKFVGGLFLLMYLIGMAQFIWVCQTHLDLNELGRPKCTFTRQIPYYQVATSVVGDGLLIGIPTYILRLLKEDFRLRRRLRLIFAASAITSCASLGTAILDFYDLEFPVLVMYELECWVSLLVCNLVILLMPILKIMGGEKKIPYSASFMKAWGLPTTNQITLTTQDFEPRIIIPELEEGHDHHLDIEMGKLELDHEDGDHHIQASTNATKRNHVLAE